MTKIHAIGMMILALGWVVLSTLCLTSPYLNANAFAPLLVLCGAVTVGLAAKALVIASEAWPAGRDIQRTWGRGNGNINVLMVTEVVRPRTRLWVIGSVGVKAAAVAFVAAVVVLLAPGVQSGLNAMQDGFGDFGPVIAGALLFLLFSIVALMLMVRNNRR